MLIVMKIGATPEETEQVRQVVRGLGLAPDTHEIRGRVALSVADVAEPGDAALFEALSGVDQVVPVRRPIHLTLRPTGSPRTVVRIGKEAIGGGGLTLIAGPCAVETEDQLLPLALTLKRSGAQLLRGGAYKPRSSPYDFQGLGEDALRLLARARDESGLPIVTEAVDAASLALVEEYADAIQIGARNMQNFALLKRVGRSRLPVLLKRGMSADLEDLLLAAEYVLEQGNPNVVLCERGIRTFARHSRYTLDLSIVPRLQSCSHLPVIVDPSHASGRRESIAPLARAAVAVGADGVMLEVHPDPTHALCDGHQSVQPADFEALATELRALASVVSRSHQRVC
jgi:3-deoxy-7-phosphoheptulonate synthase